MKVAVKDGRRTRRDLSGGICGKHGGDTRSIEFCSNLAMNYVSCSPFRVSDRTSDDAPFIAAVSQKSAIPPRLRGQIIWQRVT
jgi:pyruvate,orthophosphate dikinase